jgi:hypothetical protein
LSFILFQIFICLFQVNNHIFYLDVSGDKILHAYKQSIEDGQNDDVVVVGTWKCL